MKKRLLVVASVAVAALALAYALLTRPMPHPAEWDRVTVGMSRDEATRNLYPAGFVSTNDTFMLSRRVGLRLWWLDVSLESDRVTGVRITAEDPHETVIQELDRLGAYLRRR